MAKNLKLFFDTDGSPRVRGPSSEKLLMAFLEADVQGSDHICSNLMDDLTAIEDKSAESREFIGNAHSVVISSEGVTIECTIDDIDENDSEESSESEIVASDTEAKDASPSSDASAATPTTATAPSSKQYQTGLKHFREVLEDWEAFILDDHTPT